MITQAVLLLQLFAPAQIADAQVAPELATFLQSGIDAENRGDLDEAIGDFQKAADFAPSSSVPLLKLGDALMRKRNYAAAIPRLEHAAELSPESVPVHQLLGYALLSQGYASKAIPPLQIAHDPAALGIAQLEADQPAEAVVNLKDALAKNPGDPDLLYYLSRAGAALASDAKGRLLEQSAQTARGHQVLGQNYYASKMFAEAEKEYEQAISLRPDLPGLHLELGEIYAATSEWAKAEERFRTETKLQPGSAEAAYRLGDVLLRQGKMKEAAEELRRSDLLRPDMPETLYALGRALSVVDPEAAQHALNRVVSLEKQTQLAAEAHLLLAGIYRKSGQPELAAREMEQYRKFQGLTTGPKQ